MTTLDPAYCADGCGRLAETERPATGELVCRLCVLPVEVRNLATRVRERAAEIRADEIDDWEPDAWRTTAAWPAARPHLGEHSSNPREDG